jgi:hypothetical protein
MDPNPMTVPRTADQPDTAGRADGHFEPTGAAETLP